MVCYATIDAAEGQENNQAKFEIVLFLANMYYSVKSYSLLLIGIGFREIAQRIKKSLQFPKLGLGGRSACRITAKTSFFLLAVKHDMKLSLLWWHIVPLKIEIPDHYISEIKVV